MGEVADGFVVVSEGVSEGVLAGIQNLSMPVPTHLPHAVVVVYEEGVGFPGARLAQWSRSCAIATSFWNESVGGASMQILPGRFSSYCFFTASFTSLPSSIRSM